MFDSYLQNHAAFIPVRLLDKEGRPVTGVAFGSVVVTLLKPDGIQPSGNITIDNVTNFWLEYTFGSFSSAGVYGLTLASANINQVGQYIIAISGGGGTAMADITVVANVAADVMTRLGTPAGASVSADIATAQNSLQRALGLLYNNSVLDQIVLNSLETNIQTARLRCYDTSVNAAAAGATGLLFTFAVTASFDINGIPTKLLMTG